MDYDFLNKVVDQIMSETRVDLEGRDLYLPLTNSPFPISTSLISLYPQIDRFLFSVHCRDVYGLNEEEINYVWGKYRKYLMVKINNG